MARVLLLGLTLIVCKAWGEGLSPDRLGVIYNRDDRSSVAIARYYAKRRHIPEANMIGLSVPNRGVIARDELRRLRSEMLLRLPTEVQSLLLVWPRPYAVECMSVTTAFAAGFQTGFCDPGCRNTIKSPLFDSDGWLPADTVGWLPAMLLPSADEALARAVVDRGIEADGSKPAGTVYLIRTKDAARNVRAAGFAEAERRLSNRLKIVDASTPIGAPVTGILAYFTGVARVEEMSKLGFRPGAAADHLTSMGGELEGSKQMSALEWLRQGATASYGSVSEPCNIPGKFPDPAIFVRRYVRGDTLLEAYWKSVAMPGQGLFIGEPLARPYESGR